MDGEDKLNTDVRFVKGVGPKRAEILKSYGILTVNDLINFFPRRHLFFGQVKRIGKLQNNEEATIIAKLTHFEYLPYRKHPRIESIVEDDSSTALVRWFHSEYLLNKLKPGQTLRISGKVKFIQNIPSFTNPKFEIISDKKIEDNKFYTQPLYPNIKGIKPSNLNRIIQNALTSFSQYIIDWLPEEIITKRGLIPLRKAYKWIHNPDMKSEWQIARKRFAYDELFFMQLGILASRHYKTTKFKAPKMKWTIEIDTRIRQRFPFTLTNDQNKVIKEIVDDMTKPTPMYRLLQGDVGSGKTIVALYAALLTVANHWQVAIMGPTEILAYQHYKKISSYLKGSRVKVGLLIGGMNKTEKEKIIKSTSSGEIDILIGTHSLIQKDVKFARLGLVVVDEQHKFGVAQRAELRAKGFAPHFLVMTATPIPRTLALTLFGELRISTIRQLPPGRRPVVTKLVPQNKREELWNFVRKKLSEGHQGFIVYPVLSESDKHELRSAEKEFKLLSKNIFPEFNLALIHGRLPSVQKEKIMTEFAYKKIHLLIATVVIEVGIDVPDATILIIEHAERFGLSQLHQLRGRIGRSGQQGYCFLLANPKTELAQKRLNIFVRTADGFKIAEADLRLRGPGEFFGTTQHGLPELEMADLIDDYQLLLLANQDAKRILSSDPTLRRTENHRIRKEFIKRLGNKLTFISAG